MIAAHLVDYIWRQILAYSQAGSSKKDGGRIEGAGVQMGLQSRKYVAELSTLQRFPWRSFAHQWCDYWRKLYRPQQYNVNDGPFLCTYKFFELWVLMNHRREVLSWHNAGVLCPVFDRCWYVSQVEWLVGNQASSWLQDPGCEVHTLPTGLSVGLGLVDTLAKLCSHVAAPFTWTFGHRLVIPKLPEAHPSSNMQGDCMNKISKVYFKDHIGQSSSCQTSHEYTCQESKQPLKKKIRISSCF